MNEIIITENQKSVLDEHISNVIENSKTNFNEINQLAMDCVHFLDVSRSKTNHLKNQNFLSKFMGKILGKNNKIQLESQYSMEQALYVSKKMIVSLAQQNALNFELTSILYNKINQFDLEVNQEINQLYEELANVLKQSKSDIVRLETRIEQLEQNVELLQWGHILEYELYNGVEYCDLSLFEKIICITNDFFLITKGNWNTKDLIYLKSILEKELQIDRHTNVNIIELLTELATNQKLRNRLFQDIEQIDENDYTLEDVNYLPFLNSIKKLNY